MPLFSLCNIVLLGVDGWIHAIADQANVYIDIGY